MRSALLVAGLLLVTVMPRTDVHGQELEPARILGLIEIPSILGYAEPTPQESSAITLYSLPAIGSDPVGVLEAPDQIEAREHGYEESGAVVYGYQRAENQTWYRVRLMSGQAGWLSERDAGRFHPLTQLLDSSLAYMTDAWDGRVYVKAGREASTQLVQDAGPETSIEIASSARIGDDIYFLVVVLSGSICTSDEPGEVIAAGWVPAYAENGEVNLWYWSRGC